MRNKGDVLPVVVKKINDLGKVSAIELGKGQVNVIGPP